MTDPVARPQRVVGGDADHVQVIYDFHVEIEVKAAPPDDARVRALIEERLSRLATNIAKKNTP